MNKKVTYFKLNLIAFSILCSSNIYAQGMNIDDFYYRDYLDLGENKGKFSANAENVALAGLHGNNKTFKKIPPFFATTNDGSVASLGRNNVVTANHMRGTITQDSKYREWGQSYYEFENGNDGNEHIIQANNTLQRFGADTLFLKTDKYIVEGALEVADPKLDVSINNINRNNINKYKDQLANYYAKFNEKYQAGSGQIRDKYFGNTLKNHDKKGAGLWEANNVHNPIIIHDTVKGVHQGLQFVTKPDENFKNWIDFGDSGSALIAFDQKEQKWKVLGVLSLMYYGSEALWSPTLKYDFDNYKAKYENQIEHYTDITNLQVNKDNILKQGSNIQINNDLDLGFGGLVFGGDHQIYNIEGNGNISKLAGFDIEEGNTVNLNIKLEGKDDHLNLPDERFHFALHKIGKGTLNVNMETKARLRFGDGMVVLRNPNAFSKIHITGYQPTLKLDTDYAIQDKVFFGNGGGKLDLNGHSQTIDNFSVNNNKAVIVNPHSAKKANISFVNKAEETLVHAKIGEKEKNNLDLTVNQKGKKLAFDGGFNVQDFNISKGNITLQGHPTVHAYLGLDGIETKDQTVIYNYLKQKNGIAPHTDLTRPNTLEQSDWETRNYLAKNIYLNHQSLLNIGKDAKVNANIYANNSSINIGGDIKHFIDRADGENTYHNSSLKNNFGYGFTYQQQTENKQLSTTYRGYLEAKNIQLNNSTLTAHNSDIISQKISLQNSGAIKLRDHSNLSVDQLNLADPHNISTDDNSHLYVKTLNVPNKEVTLNANTHISEQLVLEDGDKAHIQSNKHIYLLPRAHFAVRLSERLLKATINQSYAVPFDGLVDERENKYQIDFLNKPEDLYFTYTYDPENHEMLLTRKKEDPTSNENLTDLLNGNNKEEESSDSIPTPAPNEDQSVGPENKPHEPQISNHEQQLFHLILQARNELGSLDKQLDNIGNNGNELAGRKQLLKLIHHTEQDFNTLAKDNFILNKVNFLTRTLGDQQKENLWLNSGYSNNKFKANHIMLGSNLNYDNLTLGVAIGQFNVKTDNQDADVTLMSGKLVKNFENRWAIQSHLTGLWASNDFNFYSESVKAPQKASYKEYAVNFDMLATYQYPIGSQLSITPKLGLGYSFKHSNKVATQNFSKAKYQRQLVNLLTGVGIGYQLNQFTFGAHLDVSQALILKGKEQQLGFKNNTAYTIKTDNPDTMLSLGLQARYQVTNNFNLNAETGSSTLSPFYINLGLGYRF